MAVPEPPERATWVVCEWAPWAGAYGLSEQLDQSGGAHYHDGCSDLPGRLLKVLSPLDIEVQSEAGLEWPGTLMSFQQDGVRALVGSDRLLLADDMGLGKTLQVIAALRILRHRGDIRSVLVAAPASPSRPMAWRTSQVGP